MTDKDKPKEKSIAQALSELRRGGAKLGRLTDKQFEETLRPRSISTGNLAVDAITGVGGIPRGRVTELFGPPSSGKTTTALQCAAIIQRAGGRVAFLDYERSLDETYVRALGIDPEDTHEDGAPSFLYSQPRSFEEGANSFRRLMRYVDLVITDSVAAMVTEGELNADTGKAEFAARAKMMAQYMRQITGPLADTRTVAIFLNHIQEVIDTSPIGQKLKSQGIVRQTTPGGTALKFFASLRMSYKPIGNIRSKEYDPITNSEISIPTQTKTQVTVVKNKVGSPFGQAEVRVRFGRGFSNEWSALDVLVRHGIVTKEGSGVYRFPDPSITPTDPAGTPIGHLRGEEAVIKAMEEQTPFRVAAVARAAQLVATGWDVKASPEEIAEAQADDETDTDEIVDEMGDTSDLEASFK